MNCTDLILSPGLSCSQLTSPGDGSALFFQNNAIIDNKGNVFTNAQGATSDTLKDLGNCGNTKLYKKSEIYYIDYSKSGERTPIVISSTRCQDPGTNTTEHLNIHSHLFNSINGTLMLGINSSCRSSSHLCEHYNGGHWVALIHGFETISDQLPEVPIPASLCNNRIDDDNDGYTDLEDSHCKSETDNDESRP